MPLAVNLDIDVEHCAKTRSTESFVLSPHEPNTDHVIRKVRRFITILPRKKVYGHLAIKFIY